MQKIEQQYKKIMITVNGEPVGKGLWIDKVTYAPVQIHEDPMQPKPEMKAAVS